MNTEKFLESLKAGLVYDKLDLKLLVEEMGTKQLMKAVLDNVGNVNSLIRENMMGVHDRLVEEEHFSKDECAQLFYASLDNMQKGLGNKGDDTVFCRAFSSLYLGFIVDMDEQLGLLSDEQYIQALDTAVDYMLREADRRSFVKGKGWAHAPAHGADLLCCIVGHPKFPVAQAGRILDVIKYHITAQEAYTAGEESRFAHIIPTLLDKGLSGQALQDWIKSMLPRDTSVPYTDESYAFTRVIFNIKSFLMALYFTLGEKPKWTALRKFITEYEPTMWKLSRAPDSGA